MRQRIIAAAIVLSGLLAIATSAFAQETQVKIGAIDAYLSLPPGVDKPPVALLIAGSGTTDHDGNGPQVKPATLKKLSDQLVAHENRDAALRQARRRRLEAGIRPSGRFSFQGLR